MTETLSTFKRPPKPTKRYEEMQRAVQEHRLRIDLRPPARGKNAVLKARLLAAEPEILPPPLPSSVTKTGYYGVIRASAHDHAHRNRKPYQARIPVGKASWVHLGSYDTAEEAGRHAAAAHNALLEGSLPPPVATQHPPKLRRRTTRSSIRKPTTTKWTEDEDEQLLQILSSPEFVNAPLNRRGNISSGSNASGLGDEAYWRRVGEAMGYGNSRKGGRRCSRRWWYLNPKNAERLAEKREHERQLAKGKVKARAASQKCLTDALDNVVFEADEDPFESALAVDEDAAPVEEAQDVIVRLSQLKEPLDSSERVLYADEVLSDITAERCSDISNLDFLDDFENVDGFYEFHTQKGGFFKRVVKRTRIPTTKARHTIFTFRCSNLGRFALKQSEQYRMRTFRWAYRKRYRELKKREAFDALWRASEYDAAWRVDRKTTKTGLTLPTPAPSLPAPEPPPQDATLAPSLVQERMDTYLKVCKASLKTAMEEVDWAVVKSTPLHGTWEEEPRYNTPWSTAGIQPPMLAVA